MKPLILYHASCLDGFGAAFSAWKKFGDDAEYMPVNYNEPPPDVTGREVYILDFSYPRETMLDMEKSAAAIVVLDHHKTAQEALIDLPFATFDMNKSGCRLAWEYFHPGMEFPQMLFHIEDRDLWRFTSPHTEPFCQAMYEVIGFDFEKWDELFRDAGKVFALTQTGYQLMAIFERELDHLEKLAHKVELNDGKTGEYVAGLAANVPAKYSSKLGNRLAIISGTFGMTYYFDGRTDRWNCSLRSVGGFDVSAIAKIYDGGGHRNAAGFSIERLEDL